MRRQQIAAHRDIRKRAHWKRLGARRRRLELISETAGLLEEQTAGRPAWTRARSIRGNPSTIEDCCGTGFAKPTEPPVGYTALIDWLQPYVNCQCRPLWLNQSSLNDLSLKHKRKSLCLQFLAGTSDLRPAMSPARNLGCSSCWITERPNTQRRGDPRRSL